MGEIVNKWGSLSGYRVLRFFPLIVRLFIFYKVFSTAVKEGKRASLSRDPNCILFTLIFTIVRKIFQYHLTLN